VILALFVVLVVIFVVLPLAGAALAELVSTLVVGLLIGALGRLLVPGRQPIGLIATVVVGLVGSILGTYLSHLFAVGQLARILLEIGVAGLLVAGLVGASRSRLVSRRRSLRG